MSKLANLTVSVAVIVLAGCSDPGPYRIAVTGKLTLDGEPFAFKSLTFIPIDGTPGHGAAGFSDGEGKYRLQSMVPGAIRDYRGCPPGRYRVVVSEPVIPRAGYDLTASEQAAPENNDEPAPAIALAVPRRGRPAKGDIPPLYTSERTTPLIVEVAEGKEVIDLVLESKARSSLASTRVRP